MYNEQDQQNSNHENAIDNRNGSLPLVGHCAKGLKEQPQPYVLTTAVEDCEPAEEVEPMLFRPRLRYVDEE